MIILLPLILFALWSTTFPIEKQLLQYSTPAMSTSIRMMFSGVIILAFYFSKYKKVSVSKKQLLLLSLFAFFGIYLTNILEFWSLGHLSSSKTCFIYGLSPFFTAIFSYFHFNEKLTRKKWLGMLISALVFGFIAYNKGLEENASTIFIGLTLPEIAMTVAALSTSYGWVIIRKLTVEENLSVLFINGFGMLTGGIIALATTFFTDSDIYLNLRNINYQMLFKYVIVLTFISNILCYNLYGFLLKKYTAALISLFGLTSPIFASISAWIMTGEHVSLDILLATPALMVGLYIFYSDELKKMQLSTSRN